MRGEDPKVGEDEDQEQGSPPHARGRLYLTHCRRINLRITPACAGKTSTAEAFSRPEPDHPRMRGEDASPWLSRRPSRGSPPHARGRQLSNLNQRVFVRITPACAGKTADFVNELRQLKDHPRMRGEDPTKKTRWTTMKGSPPHARGRHTRNTVRRGCRRITPACAGKTGRRFASTFCKRDHPRMRGEDTTRYTGRGATIGSPPHARGRQNILILTTRRLNGSPPHARGRQLDSRGNPAKSSFSLPVFFCSQPSPLGWFLRWVLGLGSSLWKQR